MTHHQIMISYPAVFTCWMLIKIPPVPQYWHMTDKITLSVITRRSGRVVRPVHRYEHHSWGGRCVICVLLTTDARTYDLCNWLYVYEFFNIEKYIVLVIWFFWLTCVDFCDITIASAQLHTWVHTQVSNIFKTLEVTVTYITRTNRISLLLHYTRTKPKVKH